jgi:hypothetical protein
MKHAVMSITHHNNYMKLGQGKEPWLYAFRN